MIEVSPSHQLLSAAQIYKMFSISKTTFYRWIDEGFFEPGLRLGPNCVRWRTSTVNAFIKSMSGMHLAVPVFSKGYRLKQGKVVP